MIELFSELGRRLATLARGERADYQAIVDAAAAANPWFSPDEIRLAASNISAEMLAPERLRDWWRVNLARQTTQRADILIVMAGNVPFVGVHDLVCVVAAGHRAIVKPSSKDNVLMRWVMAQLLDIQPLTPVAFASSSADKLAAGGAQALPATTIAPAAVVAMGGDDAVAALRARYVGLPMLLRGHRSSLAVLDGAENDDRLAGLADDILTFSGLGCRNVSLVFVPRGYDFSRLQNSVSQRVNALNVKYRNNLRQARAKLRMTGAPHIDCGACLLVENRVFSPTVSVCHYAFYDSISEVKLWLSRHADEIQCVATNAACEVPEIASRTVDFGRTQRPGLADYPDGVDTVKFLLSIS